MQPAVMPKGADHAEMRAVDFSRIAQDLQIRKIQVEAVVQLLDEGNTVPFITRYRKERTGGLNEEVIRQIQARVTQARQLAERKQTILRSIEGQGKLTADLRAAILSADTSKRLEDLYLPHKPKKRTLATTARERGLEPLALAIWHRDPAVSSLEEVLPTLVNPERELNTVDDVRAGVQHILAELVSETADVRASVRSVLWETGKLRSAKHEKLQDGHGLEYKDYFQFTEPARQIPPHRILALNRGEREHALKVSLEWNAEAVRAVALRALGESLLRQASQPPPPPARPNAPPSPPPPEAQPAPPAEASASPPVEGQLAPAAEGQASPPPAPDAQPAPPVEAQAAPMPATPPPAPEPAPAPAPHVPVPNVGEQLTPDSEYRTPHAAFIRAVVDDALARLLLPSLENEIRRELKEEAEAHAVGIFARNLRSLLLQPPLHGRRVLAIDPGFRTGCKIAALDETGNLLEDAVIFPHGGGKKDGKRDKGGQPAQAPATAPATPPAAPAPAPTADPATAAAPAPAANAEAPPPQPPAPAPAPAATPDIVVSPAPEAAAAPAPSPEATPPPPAPEASAPPAPAPEAAAPAAPALEATAAAPAPAAPPAPPPPNRRDEAKAKLYDLISRHNLNVIAIGNGTACRETEEFVSELISERLPELAYVIVNEAGASVYSASAVGREEFPNFDATLRGTISIGRRLQDPLSELVKVDPQSIGVGLYQHDVNPKYLKESLEGVIESCVNQVGVDLNTASVPLLRHVSGLNQMVARDLVEYRKQNGPFKSREQLMQVPNIGPARYTQAAGFLKIAGDNPLDRTWIHPESYGVTQRILGELGYGPEVVGDRGRADELQGKLKGLSPEELAQRLEVGAPTVRDILEALARPGRDPREDLPPPIFRKGILKLEDLTPGMELKGTVLNVVDFGAFVDIGLKDSGLVHISQMANRYIKSPYDVVAVGDVVTVWVLTVDKERHRVSLTMIKPGTERRPPERKPAQQAAPQGGARPPRGGRRPQGRPQGQGAGQGGGQGPGRGPGRGPGPRRGPAPGQPVPAGQEGAAVATTGPAEGGAPAARSGPPPRPAPPPRKPRREPPKPKLSQAALEGKAPLRTFAELSALLAAKQAPPRPAPAPQAAQPVPSPEPNAEAASTAPAESPPAPAPAGENPPPPA